jgi:hypothetical protein
MRRVKIMSMNKEYEMLREEIMFNTKQKYLSFTFTVPIVSGVLVFVLPNIDKPNSIHIFCAIFVFIVCAVTRVKRLTNGIEYISTYMEVFLEPNIDDRNWETRCNRRIEGYSGKEVDKNNPLLNIMFLKSFSAWLLLGIIIYFLFIMILYENYKDDLYNIFKYFLIDCIFNTIMFFIILYVTLSNKRNIRDKYIKHWESIKQNEQGTMSESRKLGV